MESTTQNQGHAYHYNLPPHYMDKDGVPLVIKYANDKARTIVETAYSIQLSAELFVGGEHRDRGTDEATGSAADGGGGENENDNDNDDKSALVSFYIYL